MAKKESRNQINLDETISKGPEDAKEETEEKISKENRFNWARHYNLWIELVRNTYKEDEEHKNSLVNFYLSSIQKSLVMIQYFVLRGVYRVVLRELRYMLESMVLAYYIDQEHPNAGIDCKIEIQKEVTEHLYGSRLIDSLENFDNKKQIKEIYRDLSDYIHPTLQELGRPEEFPTRVTFKFNKDWFDRVLDYTEKVMDAIFFICLNRFEEIVDEMKKDKMIDSFKGLNYRLTLQFLK